MKTSSSNMVLALGAALLALSPSDASAFQQRQATAVRVEAAQIEHLQSRRMVTGALRAVRRSDVAAQEPGVVLELPVREGQMVEQGAMQRPRSVRRSSRDGSTIWTCSSRPSIAERPTRESSTMPSRPWPWPRLV
jgi:hypothetical protein